jgi:hypothetical protein
MSEEIKETEITCKICGRKVMTDGSGDFSSFICEVCQEKANLPAYEAEMLEYEGGDKEGLTESQLRRVSFLQDKINAVKAILQEEEDAAKAAEEKK